MNHSLRRRKKENKTVIVGKKDSIACGPEKVYIFVSGLKPPFDVLELFVT